MRIMAEAKHMGLTETGGHHSKDEHGGYRRLPVLTYSGENCRIGIGLLYRIEEFLDSQSTGEIHLSGLSTTLI